VALIARVFGGLSGMIAGSEGLPELNRVIFPHPLNHLPEEEIRSSARALSSDVLGSLVEKSWSR
jgi:hypothetical protein